MTFKSSELMGIVFSIIITVLAVIFSLGNFSFTDTSLLQTLNITSNDDVTELGITLSVIAILLTGIIFIFQTKITYDQRKITAIRHEIITSKENFEQNQKDELQKDIGRITCGILDRIQKMKEHKKNWELLENNIRKEQLRIIEKNRIKILHEELLEDVKELQGIDFLSNPLLPQKMKKSFKKLIRYNKNPISNDVNVNANLSEINEVEDEITSIVKDLSELS